MLTRSLCALLLLVAAALPATADDAQLRAAEKEKQTLESYAAMNKTCHEWTDGCAVCARRGDATFACSLPGIACEPTGLTCRNAAQGKDGGTKGSGTPGTPAK